VEYSDSAVFAIVSRWPTTKNKTWPIVLEGLFHTQGGMTI
jgi:hypothetical protein